MGLLSGMPDRGKSKALELFVVVLSLFLLTSLDAVAAEYVEQCAAGAVLCPSRVAHVANGNQSLDDIAHLYTVSVQELLGANNLDLTEANVTNKLVPNSNVVEIPLLCDCINATRKTNSTTYTVKASDTLSMIASNYFEDLVTYQEIGIANKIPDVSQIQPGQRFVIPFPCACRNNTFKGAPAVFLTYKIQPGDNLSVIAATYGRTADDLAYLNQIQNVSNILAGDRLQIPLAACSSNFDRKAVDYGLLVTDGTYSLSPQAGCVLSSCYGNPPELHSAPAPKLLFSSEKCPNLACANNLAIGNINTSSAATDVCMVTACVYDGYANSTTIFTKSQEYNQTTCPVKTLAPPEQQVETTPSPPMAFSPPPSGTPTPSSQRNSATRSSLVPWRNAMGFAFGFSILIFHLFQFGILLVL